MKAGGSFYTPSFCISLAPLVYFQYTWICPLGFSFSLKVLVSFAYRKAIKKYFFWVKNGWRLRVWKDKWYRDELLYFYLPSLIVPKRVVAGGCLEFYSLKGWLDSGKLHLQTFQLLVGGKCGRFLLRLQEKRVYRDEKDGESYIPKLFFGALEKLFSKLLASWNPSTTETWNAWSCSFWDF